ncbi:hypothetical protein BC828DRAFT_290122 [Blastocladiella britannica]|nr:hypothetical protein BC828DRAFT_290122 [Blastocladiella britannica]
MIQDGPRAPRLPGAADDPVTIIETETIIVNLATQRSHLGEIFDGIVSSGMDPDAVAPARDGMCSLPVKNSPGLGHRYDHWVGEDAGASDSNNPHDNLEHADEFAKPNEFAEPGDEAAATEADAAIVCGIARCPRKRWYSCRVGWCVACCSQVFFDWHGLLFHEWTSILLLQAVLTYRQVLEMLLLMLYCQF